MKTSRNKEYLTPEMAQYIILMLIAIAVSCAIGYNIRDIEANREAAQDRREQIEIVIPPESDIVSL